MYKAKPEEIQERIDEVKDLLGIWMRFYNILAAGFDSQSITPEKEKEFNEIKTMVAQRHRHFMEVITEENDRYIGQNILNLVKRVISLKEFGTLSAIEINKISIEWHDANVLLNEILGSLEYQLEITQKKKSPKTRSGGGGSKSKVFIIILILALVALVAVYFLFG